MRCQHLNKAILSKILTGALPNTNQQSEDTGHSGIYCDTSITFKPTKDGPQGSGGFKKQSLLLLGEKFKINSRASPKWNKLVFWHQMLARCAICLLLVSGPGPAWEATQKKFEQERLSIWPDCMEYFME